MQDLNEIKELLLKILRKHGEEKAECIRNVQDKIWDEKTQRNAAVQEILDDLASDLNFYESEERDRDEELGYYGEEHLEEVIDSIIKKIEAIGEGN